MCLGHRHSSHFQQGGVTEDLWDFLDSSHLAPGLDHSRTLQSGESALSWIEWIIENGSRRLDFNSAPLNLSPASM